jgi:hypothetical protein
MEKKTMQAWVLYPDAPQKLIEAFQKSIGLGGIGWRTLPSGRKISATLSPNARRWTTPSVCTYKILEPPSSWPVETGAVEENRTMVEYNGVLVGFCTTQGDDSLVPPELLRVPLQIVVAGKHGWRHMLVRPSDPPRDCVLGLLRDLKVAEI